MVVPFGKVVEVEEFEIADGDKVLFKAIIKTNDVVIGEAPEDVGDMVVRIVVTNCEGFTLLLDAEDEVREAVSDWAVVDDCAATASAPRSVDIRDLTRIARVLRKTDGGKQDRRSKFPIYTNG